MGHPITPYMIDGFEHGRATGGAVTSVADAIGGTPAIVTTPVRTDTRALEITAAGAAESYRYNLAASNRIVTAGFAVRYAALPTADHVIFHFVNTGNDPQIRFDNATDRFCTSVQNVDNNVFGPNPIVVNTWYLIVVEADTSANPTVVRARCFDATTGALIGAQQQSTNAQAAVDSTSIGPGTQSAETFTMYVDDLVVSLTDGDYEDWPHMWRIQALVPTADGTHNITTLGDMDSFTATAFDNSTTTGFGFIDHRPLNVANTANDVIRQDFQSATTYMELLWGDSPAGTDNALAVRGYGTHVMSSTTGTPTGEMRLLLADNTEVLTTGSLSVIDASDTDPGTTVTLRKRMTIPPSGGWNRGLVDGAKVRIGFNNIAADENFIDAMLEVLLVTGSLPPVRPSFTHMLVR